MHLIGSGRALAAIWRQGEPNHGDAERLDCINPFIHRAQWLVFYPPKLWRLAVLSPQFELGTLVYLHDTPWYLIDRGDTSVSSCVHESEQMHAVPSALFGSHNKHVT